MDLTYIKELNKDEELVDKVLTNFPKCIKKAWIYIKKKLGICTTIKIEEQKKIKILPYRIEELIQKQKWYEKKLSKEKNIILSKNLFLNKSLKTRNT